MTKDLDKSEMKDCGEEEIPEVSFLVPAYNEALNLPVVVDGILKYAKPCLGENFEILIYQDCSLDNSAEVANQLARDIKQVRVLHNPANRGMAFSMIESLRTSNAEWIFFVPGDDQFEYSEIPRFLKAREDVDFVISYYSNPEIRPMIRRASSKAFHQVVRALFKIPYRYYNWIFVYKRELFAKLPLTTSGHLISSEMVYLAHHAGFRIKEIPSELKMRTRGKSSIRPAVVAASVWGVLRLWYRHQKS